MNELTQYRYVISKGLNYGWGWRIEELTKEFTSRKSKWERVMESNSGSYYGLSPVGSDKTTLTQFGAKRRVKRWIRNKLRKEKNKKHPSKVFEYKK